MIPDKTTLKTGYPKGFSAKLLIMLANTTDLWRRFTQSVPCQVEEAAYLQTVCRQQREGLPQIIQKNPMLVMGHPQRKEPVEWVACQIRRGVIPALVDLAEIFPTNPDTPQCRQLLNRFHYFLGQAGELGNMRGTQLRLALGLRSRKNRLRQLASSPTAPNARQTIETRTHPLNALIHETENALIQLLSTDPCVGDSIHLNTQQQAYSRWIQKTLRWLDSVRTFQPHQIH